MSMAIIGVSVTAAAVGLSAYEYASAPGAPKPPNLGQATRAGVEAQAATLPDQLRLQAAAQEGVPVTYNTYAHTEQVGYVKAPNGKTVQYNPGDWQQGGQYYQAGKAPPKVSYKNVKVPAGTATADFTGYGQAEVQGKVAQQNAAQQLALEQKYGPQFIDEALKEEQLANPQGTAARAQEYNLIKQEENQTPDRPVATLLDSQVQQQLAAGKGLDPVAASVLKDAVASAQSARGAAPGGGAQPDYSEPLTTGFQGEQRLSAAEQKALGWLTSGATPEDVSYRRSQQTMADLSNFVNNKTPESQFASLSGAQKGPAPYSVASQPVLNQQAGTQGATAALAGYPIQLNSAENTANSWMAGISSAVKAAGAANTLLSPGGG